MKILLVVGGIILLLAIVRIFFSLSPTQISSIRVPQRSIDFTVESQIASVKLEKQGNDAFAVWANSLGLPTIDTLMLKGSNRTVSIQGYQHIHFMFASSSAVGHPDLVTQVQLPRNLLPSVNEQTNNQETWEFRYNPFTKTVDIVVALSPDSLAASQTAGTKNLELKLNDVFLEGMYLMTYQAHQAQYPKYLDFLAAYDPIQTELFVHGRTFVKVLE